MAWNNIALYVGITLGSIIGGAVLEGLEFSALPYVCSGVALISFGISMRKLRKVQQEPQFIAPS